VRGRRATASAGHNRSHL